MPDILLEKILHLIDRFYRDGLGAWSEALSFADQALERENRNLFNPNSPEIMEVIENIEGDPKEYGPWVGKDGNPFRLYVSATFLNKIKSQVRKTKDHQAGLHVFIAMLVYLDRFLKDLIRSQQTSWGGESRRWRSFQKSLLDYSLVMVPKEQREPKDWLVKKWWPKTLRTHYRSTAIGLPFSRWVFSLRHTPLPVRVISVSELLGVSKEQASKWFPVIKLVALPTDFKEYLEIVSQGAFFFIRERKPHPWLTAFVEQLNRKDERNIENVWFVFPELTVFPGIREGMQKAMESQISSFTHIIAGSEHIALNGMNANRSCLLSKRHWTPDSIYHLKKFGVRFRPDEFKAATGEKEQQKGTSNQDEITELLELAGGTGDHPLVCLETPWGRVSFIICRDALEEDNPMLKCIRVAEVDHLFVISLNPGAPSEFEGLGKKLTKHQIATYYVNTQLPGKNDPLIMVHLPAKASDHSLAKAFVPRETGDHASGSCLDDPGSGITASVEDGVHCCTIDLAQLISWLPDQKKQENE